LPRRRHHELLPDDERDHWLNDLEELDRIADSATGLVREEAEPGSAEPLPLDRLIPDLVDDLAGLGIAVRLGPGIPHELVEQVFEPFFRVDPGRRQQVPGAGLGLAIAREIVVRCGGGIAIRNRDGGGLVQTVTLAPCPWPLGRPYCIS
jgi:Histidine kinase-, DNA gyrase B-, and HSP90-like ATPase